MEEEHQIWESSNVVLWLELINVRKFAEAPHKYQYLAYQERILNNFADVAELFLEKNKRALRKYVRIRTFLAR